MDKKLNVALFSDNFLPGVGGTENAILHFATELANQGHKVVVVAPHYRDENDAELPFGVIRVKSIRMYGNDYYCFPFKAKYLTKQLENFSPDIIHCHSHANLLSLALKYAKYFNIPCISTIHTKFSFCYKNAIPFDFIVNPMMRAIGRRIKKANKLIAVSYDMQGEFEKYGYTGNFDVIKNGASFHKLDDPDLKKLAQEKYNLTDDDNILLFVGHISKIKNLKFIFDSLDILFNTYTDFKMLFVGAGYDMKYFTNLAQKKAYKDKILFTDKITDKRLLQSIYSNAKLYIFPSIFDNDSLSIVEASVYSVPSITIKGTGSSERIIDNQSGFVIENNPKQMAERIEYLLKNPEFTHQIGKNASEQLPKSWTMATNEYLNIYEQELSAKPHEITKTKVVKKRVLAKAK